MSIDTYDTLAMVRRNTNGRYNLAWIEPHVRQLATACGATVAAARYPQGSAYLAVRKAAAELNVCFSDEPHVPAESDEIANDYQADCAGSAARFELFGTDLELDLMTIHQILLERLDATGDFVLFSGQAGLLMEDN